MNRTFFLAVMCFLLGRPPGAHADFRPANGAVLNYTHVMFEYGEVRGATGYRITISDRSGSKPPLQVQNASLAFLQRSGLEFGHQYVWYVEALRGDRPIQRSENRLFDIRAGLQADSAMYRTRIDQWDSLQCADGIVFLDYLGMAINRKGEPVWFMPVNPDSLENLKLRNLTLTPEGTVTYLDNTHCFEKDLQGNTLWRAPNDGRVSGERQEYYHHDFRKLPDGTYLTTGYRFVAEPHLYDSSVMARVRYNTLIQYDARGNIVWKWDEQKHISRKVIYGANGPGVTDITGTHLNGFAVDTAHDRLVLSFRDNSSVLIISRKTGDIVYNLGDSVRRYLPRSIFFSAQHGPSLLRNGNIVVYNNCLDRKGTGSSVPLYPRVQVFSLPVSGKRPALIWEYECRPADYPQGIQGKEGYASQVAGTDNLLVCVGGANLLLEVTPTKRVVWRCRSWQYDKTDAQWKGVNNYRCSFARSLYPCYFTLQRVERKTDNGQPAVDFRLNNEGMEAQSFDVELSGAGEIPLARISTGVIPARSGMEMTLPVKKEFSGAALTLRVYPSGKPGMVRTSSLLPQ